jgi:hypothetical protein
MLTDREWVVKYGADLQLVTFRNALLPVSQLPLEGVDDPSFVDGPPGLNGSWGGGHR